MPDSGTFAAAAARGIFLDMRCSRCRHDAQVSCRSLVARGLGEVQLVGSQPRFRCRKCGKKGQQFTIHGYWLGPGDQPPDWAETVEERMAP